MVIVGSCEYCLVHADYAVLVHEIDHAIAEKHGGITEAENFAYACAQCNRFSSVIVLRVVILRHSISTQGRSSCFSIPAGNGGRSIFVSTVRSLCLLPQLVEQRNDYCS